MFCLTWECNSGECGAEEEDGVAHIVQIKILDGARAQHDEDHHEDAAVHAVVQVVQSGSLNVSHVLSTVVAIWTGVRLGSLDPL